jgi:hypothetical protein
MAKEIDYVELLKLAHEKLGSQSDMIADIERRLNISECMVDNLRSVKAEMEAERYLKDKRIAELESVIESLNYTLQSYEQE